MVETHQIELLSKLVKNTAPKHFKTELRQTTTTGTIQPGWNKVSIYVSGQAAGTITIGGVALDADPGETHVFGSDAFNIATDAITYSATGTEFKIIISRV